MDGLLTAEEVASLGARGFFRRDGFLGDPLARTLSEAAEQEVARGALHPAAVGRGGRHGRRPAIRGDATCWVTATGPPWGDVRTRLSALQEALRRDAYLGLDRYELQLARYPGEGTAYARHRDAFATPGPRRRVTAILYLNATWAKAHGGLLRLHLPEGALDVEPVLDRLVVFLSERVEHEVLPTHAPRLALTAWFYGVG